MKLKDLNKVVDESVDVYLSDETQFLCRMDSSCLTWNEISKRDYEVIGIAPGKNGNMHVMIKEVTK